MLALHRNVVAHGERNLAESSESCSQQATTQQFSTLLELVEEAGKSRLLYDLAFHMHVFQTVALSASSF